MNNHIQHILAAWLPEKDNSDWVAGFVYQTQGPCYRKTGALMLFSGDGQQLGLLSGGCLEADLMRRARMVMQTQSIQTQRYDASDDNDLSFQLGIGCGGIVDIVLLPVTKQNNYLGLVELIESLQARTTLRYQLNFEPPLAITSAKVEPAETKFKNHCSDQQLAIYCEPLTHLLIVGGGIDARPLAQLAVDLGWLVSLCDPRPANARAEHFQSSTKVTRDIDSLSTYCQQESINAAVVMSHSISMDAAALAQLQLVSLNYLALLGPTHRKQQVLEAAELHDGDFSCDLFGPAGFDIGGELPESIALSILAQCHAELEGKRLN